MDVSIKDGFGGFLLNGTDETVKLRNGELRESETGNVNK